MTRIINLISGKGGVGKTTLTANLAYALAELGEEVVAIDANLTTPHLGLHLGLQFVPITLHDVLKGSSSLKHALYPHRFGFKVLPGSLSVNDLQDVDVGKLPEIILSLLGKADYILLDSAPGLGREAVSSLSSTQEILVVTNPDMPSLVDALKVLKVAESIHKQVIGVILNRVGRKAHELSKAEVENILGFPVLVEIPEDKNIPKSIAMKRPLLDAFPDSPAAVEIRRLAHNLAGIPFRYKPRKPAFNLIERLVNWMVR